MGRTPQYCSKDGFNRGAWTSMEDKLLTDYVAAHGEGKWSNVAKKMGLKRCGKSCRLRWLNYLRPDIKRGNISHDEEELIVRLHKLLGNRWSLIAGRLPGRTDNEIKNYWNSTLAKKTHQFQFLLPKFNTKNDVPATPTSQPPALTPANGSHDNQNPEATEPTVWPSKDDEINLPDFLFDFNMEDFGHILDAPADNNYNNNNGYSNHNDDDNNIRNEEKYWEENEKCGDQLINGSDFMSLVPFIDSDQVVDWSEMA